MLMVVMLLVGAVVLKSCMTGFEAKHIGVKAVLPGVGDLNVSMQDVKVNDDCSSDEHTDDLETKLH